jgi:hypothetical protein
MVRRSGEGGGLGLTSGDRIDRRCLQTCGTPTTDFIDLAASRAEKQKGYRREDPGLFIAGRSSAEGLGFSAGGDRVARREAVRGRESCPRKKELLTCGPGSSARWRGYQFRMKRGWAVG